MKKWLSYLLPALVPAGMLLSCNGPGKRFNQTVTAALELDSTSIGVSTVAEGLNVPWEICWGPDGHIWFTEQSGTVSKVDPVTGKQQLLLTIPEVYRHRSLGLLGMAVHPTEPYVYLDYTHRTADSLIVSRLVRYTRGEDTLTDTKILLEFPGNTGHNGSRVIVGPDGKVYFSTGDAHHDEYAGDISKLNGKVLRLNADGSVPDDNPYPGNYMWSRGHRNIQGLTFTDNGHLFASEHGDATDDELNFIRKAAYYAWPHIEGYADRPAEKAHADTTDFTPPAKAWTPTIAPAGIAYYNHPAIRDWQNTLLLGTLKGASLHVIRLNDARDSVLDEKVYFTQHFGRIRGVCVSPDGDIYLATSNRDWNPGKGFPIPADDRIIRLSPIADTKGLIILPGAAAAPAAPVDKGAAIYKSYCEACHKADGKGVTGSFPALDQSQIVTGKPEALIHILLNGSKSTATEQMPAFQFLSDEDLAAVATHIRSAWSNQATGISDADIKAGRKPAK
ncbi:PQQ-dependent sugar dehydrogenase [Chitinophaga pollutisoli]|uniref:PQQ-dependent sugar dehydrogenase n=1 Tax=Chitinophaga pollutisoli TaxID=3133966 RepID=A0ABZ2YKP5_9BACT